MALTWSLVNTTVREADLSVAQRLGGWVDGNRVVFYMVRNASVELWRSDDRGVTFSQYTVTGVSGSTNVTGPSDKFDSKYWIKSQADNLLVHTPSSNPGAGGLTREATGAISPVHYPQSNDVYLHLIDNGVGGTNQIFRRTAAATFTGLNMGVGDTYTFVTKIPDTSDFLLIVTTATGVIRRITPAASPVTLVNDFTMAQINFNNAPVSPVACLSENDYYVSAAGVDSDPAIIYKTTDGGSSWTATNPSSGFWEAFASGGRQGHATGFVRYEGRDYCFVTFKDAALPLETQEHVKVAKFNATSWDPESNDTNDGFRVIHTLAGVNADGNLDFYAVTYDAATDTTKVYRATVTATPPSAPVSERINYAAAGSAFCRYADPIQAVVVGFPTGESTDNDQTIVYHIGKGWVEDSRKWRDVIQTKVIDQTKLYAWDYDAGILREIDVDEIYTDDGEAIWGEIDTGYLQFAGPDGGLADLIARWHWLKFVAKERVDVHVFIDSDDMSHERNFAVQSGQDARMGLVGVRVRVKARFVMRGFFRLIEILMRGVPGRGFRPR